MARARSKRGSGQQDGQLVCPECGRSFSRAAALGAHRRRAHGVVGSSRAAQGGRRASAAATADGAARRGARTRPASTGSSGSGSRAGRRRSSAATGSASVDRDALLQALFPAGIPAREGVIRGVNAWLDEAERLATMA